MKINILSDSNNINAEQVEISDDLFNHKFNPSLVHQIVVAYLANSRQGSHSQKNRSSVKGGNKKPRPQKGTGRARAGTSRSPIWRSGGVTFARSPKDYGQKINKKMYKAAIKSIFSELFRENRIFFIDNFSLQTNKTRELLEKLKGFNFKDILIISDEIDNNLYLASRNLVNVNVCDTVATNPVDLINYSKVLITRNALKQLEKVLL